MGQILSILWEILSILWEICYCLIGIFRNHSPPGRQQFWKVSPENFFWQRGHNPKKSGKFLSAPLIFSFPYAHGYIIIRLYKAAKNLTCTCSPKLPNNFYRKITFYIISHDCEILFQMSIFTCIWNLSFTYFFGNGSYVKIIWNCFALESIISYVHRIGTLHVGKILFRHVEWYVKLT
jgi:hypothetical protein